MGHQRAEIIKEQKARQLCCIMGGMLVGIRWASSLLVGSWSGAVADLEMDRAAGTGWVDL